MHEIGICEGVLAAVEQRAGGRPVAALGVRAGTMLRMVPEAFAQSFELVAAGSIAEGAVPELVITPVTATCRRCGAGVESLDAVPACPGCGSVDLDRADGDELVLEWIRYAEEV